MSVRTPCPGCTQVIRDRQVGQVCRNCRYRLDHYAEMEETARRAWRDREAALAQQDLEAAYIPLHEHDTGFFAAHLSRRTMDTLRDAFRDTLRACSKDGYRASDGAVIRSFGFGHSTCGFPRGAVDAFLRLRSVVTAALVESGKEGFQQGCNVLSRLANGDISTADFERRREGGQ